MTDEPTTAEMDELHRQTLIDLAEKAGVVLELDRETPLTTAEIEAVFDAHYAAIGQQVIDEYVEEVKQGRPIWESGESYQSFQARLAEYKAAKAAEIVVDVDDEPFPDSVA